LGGTLALTVRQALILCPLRFSGRHATAPEARLRHIKRFILFHGKRHPREMDENQIREYLSHLAVERNVSASSQNVALAAHV